MLSHFLEDYRSCDADGRGGNLTALQQRYHQAWLAMAPFQLHRNRRLCGAVVGFRSRPGSHSGAQLLRPQRPIARVRDVEFLSYVPIPHDCVQVSGRGAPRRQNYREHFEIRGAILADGDVRFTNRQAASRKVVQHDGSLQPRQDHPAYLNKRYGHVDGGGLGDQIQEVRDAQQPDSAVIMAPLSGRLAVRTDDLWYHVLIGDKSVFRVPLAQKDAFVFTADGQENPELAAAINRGYVQRGQVLTRLSGPVEYLAAVVDNGSTKTVFIGGDPPTASRHPDRLEFIVEAKSRLAAYNHAVEFEGTIPPDTDLPFEDRFPRLLLELPRAIVQQRRSAAVGWQATEAFREHVLASVNTRQYALELPGLNYPVPSYEQLATQLGDELVHVEDMLFDAMLVAPGQLGWVGEGVLVDSRVAGEALRARATDRWLDFSELAEFYQGEACHDGSGYMNGLYVCPTMPLDLTKGLTRRVNDVEYDFQPTGARFDQIEQKLQQGGQRSSGSGRGSRRQHASPAN